MIRWAAIRPSSRRVTCSSLTPEDMAWAPFRERHSEIALFDKVGITLVIHGAGRHVGWETWDIVGFELGGGHMRTPETMRRKNPVP